MEHLLGLENNRFKPEDASYSPVEIFKNRLAWEDPRLSESRSQAVGPRYFLNAPQMTLMSSQADEPLIGY